MKIKKILSASLAAATFLLLAGCTTAQPVTPTTTTGNSTGSVTITPPATSTTSASLVAAAATVTDVCTLMPMDLAAKIVPNGGAPLSQKFPPLRCDIGNGTSTLEVTLATYDTGGYSANWSTAESISGLAQGAYLEHLDPATPGDVYLTVLLGKDAGELYVEVAGHDGKDHRDDAIAVAKEVLAKLSAM